MIFHFFRTIAPIRFVSYGRLAVCQAALFAGLASAGTLLCEPVAAQATFTPLGKFGGIESGAFDISADGSVIVGTSVSLPGPTVSVFRLTPQGTTVRPTGLTGPATTSTAVSLSADGSTVVGTFLSSSGEEAFRWVGDGPFEGLGDLPGGDFHSNAFGVSADGSVVVGASVAQSRLAAFRWTAGGGIVSLGVDERTARAVSADGSVAVGQLWVGDDAGGPAYRWTMQTGSMELPELPRPRPSGAEARAVTADGLIVVGFDIHRPGLGGGIENEAFRWTQEEGSISLTSPGWQFTVPSDLSGNGSVVVGSGNGPFANSGAAFIWTAERV